MSLDVVILDKSSGTPLKQVNLSLQMHSILCKNLVDRNFKLLSRFSEYYKDGHFVLNELPSLKNEIQTLLSDSDNKDLKTFLKDLLKLLEFALISQNELHLISD